MARELKTEYFQYVPVEMWSRAYIAGGAAVLNGVDPRDIDMWIIGSEDADMDKLKVMEHLNTLGHKRFYEIGPGVYAQISPYKSLEGLVADDDLQIRMQIMISSHTEIEYLLAEFDLSVHACAYNSFGLLTKGASWTPPGQTIHVQRWTTPHSTLRRLIQLSDRYRSTLPWNEIEQLAALIVAAETRKAQQRVSDLIGRHIDDPR